MSCHIFARGGGCNSGWGAGENDWHLPFNVGGRKSELVSGRSPSSLRFGG
jgi:hypothetical protein